MTYALANYTYYDTENIEDMVSRTLSFLDAINDCTTSPTRWLIKPTSIVVGYTDYQSPSVEWGSQAGFIKISFPHKESLFKSDLERLASHSEVPGTAVRLIMSTLASRCVQVSWWDEQNIVIDRDKLPFPLSPVMKFRIAVERAAMDLELPVVRINNVSNPHQRKQAQVMNAKNKLARLLERQVNQQHKLDRAKWEVEYYTSKVAKLNQQVADASNRILAMQSSEPKSES